MIKTATVNFVAVTEMMVFIINVGNKKDLW
jgi:hypothetical protein